MERRKFLSWAGVGILATSLPVVIAACSSPSSESPSSESPSSEADSAATETPASTVAGSSKPDADGFYEVGTKAQLSGGGAIALDKFAGGSGALIVIQDPAKPESIIALDASCTHSGCPVEWKEGVLLCPCHASAFGLDGVAQKGPASQPLAVFEAKLVGDKVLVKAS
jgi:cytochrome b6-f complex iron-sulfur subunit